MNKFSKLTLIAAVALFALGCLLLTIGMSAKVDYVSGYSALTGEPIVEKGSVAQAIKEWNDAAGLTFGLVDKTNLFDLHSNWQPIVDEAKSFKDAGMIGDGLFMMTQADYDTIMHFNSMLNTAVAGFSFIIIGLITAIIGVVLNFVIKKED